MCKLTPLSTTKIVLSTNLGRGNKIYIKVKKTWALCGLHDHRPALENGELMQVFNGTRKPNHGAKSRNAQPNGT